eukprot:2455340-Amphidinium_carterae.1
MCDKHSETDKNLNYKPTSPGEMHSDQMITSCACSILNALCFVTWFGGTFGVQVWGDRSWSLVQANVTIGKMPHIECGKRREGLILLQLC